MWHFFKHIWIQEILFKIPNHFWRNPFLNFDSYMNLNPSYVTEEKKYKKNVSERVKRSIWAWWNNCTLEMIVWKGKRMLLCTYFSISRGYFSHRKPCFWVFPCSWFHIYSMYLHFEFKDTLLHGFLQIWLSFRLNFFFGQYCSEFKLHVHVLSFVEICLFYKLKLWEKFLPVNFDEI